MSLRRQLIAGFVATIITVTAIIAVLTHILLSDHLTRNLDEQLRSSQSRARDFGPVLGEGGWTIQCPATHRPNRRQPDNSLLAMTFDDASSGIATAEFGECRPLSTSALASLRAIPSDGKARSVTVAELGRYRVISTRSPDGEILVIGLNMQQVDNTRLQLVLILIAGSLAATLLGVGGVYLLLRRALIPLDRVAATARAVSQTPLATGDVVVSARVPLPDTDPRTEVGQVGQALNQMIDHVQAALSARHISETRVRRFVADASHELRTPLAAIRGYAELANRNPDDAAAVQHALSRVRSESDRMGTLVDDLLLLARLDSGRPLAAEIVDLTRLTIDAVSDARVAGRRHHWQLHLPDEPVLVVGDSARLQQVLGNLLSNARTHTPPGTTVTTSIEQQDTGTVLSVSDDGPGIPAHLQAEVFGRFVRGDDSRSRTAGSTGLGLAIVAAVVSAHHGTVHLASAPGQTRFDVTLPRLGSVGQGYQP